MVADGGFIVVACDLIVVDGDLLVVDGGCFFLYFAPCFFAASNQRFDPFSWHRTSPGICEAAFTNTMQKQQLTETC